MVKANVLTLQDLVEQGYTPTQIVNLIAGIQEAQEKSKAEAEAKRQAELKAQEEAKRKAKVEAAKKTLIAAWYAYCDTVGVGTDARDIKFRNDMINTAIETANIAADPTEENLENWLTGLLKLTQ